MRCVVSLGGGIDVMELVGEMVEQQRQVVVGVVAQVGLWKHPVVTGGALEAPSCALW
jgi:hypothetical protein